MIKDVISHDNDLIIFSDQGRSIAVTLDHQIEKAIIFKDSALVLTLSNRKTYGDRNIFRISEGGKIIWQIAQPDKFRGIDADRSACFTYIGIDKDGKVKAGCLNDFTYEVDFETGKLLSKVHDK